MLVPGTKNTKSWVNCLFSYIPASSAPNVSCDLFIYENNHHRLIIVNEKYLFVLFKNILFRPI